MADTLDDVKKRLKSRYVGKSGIHAIGVRRSQNALCVYVDPRAGPSQVVLDEIERDAAPFKLLILLEEPPSLR